MTYNVYIRIPDASRECGWTQVWLDSFQAYDDAVRFIRGYNSDAVTDDRLLAVTANESDGVYDEKETLLAAGSLEPDAGIGIVSDEEVSVSKCNASLYAVDLMDMKKHSLSAGYVLDRIRDSQRSRKSFSRTMVSINVDFLVVTLSMVKDAYPYAESRIVDAENFLSGKTSFRQIPSNNFYDLIHRSKFEESINYAAYHVDIISTNDCIRDCAHAMGSLGTDAKTMNKIFTEAIFRHITMAQAFCDVFFLGEQR